MTTPFDVLVDALKEAGMHDPNAEAPPEAILWCDPKREWSAVVRLLRPRLPELLTLGDYDPSTRTGPAVWLRAAIARALTDLELQENQLPIVHMPGVRRDTLRAAEDCPEDLVLLAWLAVTGCFFAHINGKEWTLRSFLAGERGPLKLDVADDAATRAALLTAALKLFTTPIEDLQGRRLDADGLQRLLVPDLPADMLDWLAGSFDPQAEPERFAAFADQAREKLKFDPAKGTPDQAAERLAAQEGGWKSIWQRFAANPKAHGAIVPRLEHLSLPELFADRTAYPRLNDTEEQKLRVALLALENMAESDARAAILDLDKEHAWRRETIWAELGRTALAQALHHLAQLARLAGSPTQNAKALAESYASEGWQVDAAALRSYTLAERQADRAAVVAALRGTYLPWLERTATALQHRLRDDGWPTSEWTPPDADAIVFVDGLRMDLAQTLLEMLKARGADGQVRWRFAAFPTVTGSCKPLASPVAKAFKGVAPAADFLPVRISDGRPARKDVLEQTLEDEGWSTGTDLIGDRPQWVETGHFDHDGHALQARMADQIERSLRHLSDELVSLAQQGKRVRVVTDHGWLLVPGGLPVLKLPSGLTESRWSRCALVKEGAATSVPQYPWTWDVQQFVASAPGATAFQAGQAYAHGGVSLQESVVPELLIEPLSRERRVEITNVAWRGLRVRVAVTQGDGLTVDLREGARGEGASLADRARILDAEGRTSLLVVDDRAEGREAAIVVFGEGDTVLSKTKTIIGGGDA